MNAISLFSGCGGLDFGIEAAGFNVSVYNDNDSFCCSTLRLNNKLNIIEAPIENVSISDITPFTGSSRNSIDLVVGGPPCQPFSKSGYWRNGDTLRLSDPRASTLTHYFRIISELLPRCFLLENVHGLNYSGKEEGFHLILESIKNINRVHCTNYIPVWRVINMADYGVPQQRIRFFLIAMRDDKEFVFPEPTHTRAPEFPDFPFDNKTNLQSYVTSWEAIGKLQPDSEEHLSVGGQWGDLLPSIPEGENYLWHTDRKGGLPLFGWRTRFWSFLLKLAKQMPSWTIQAQPGSAVGPFHWDNRKLSWRELAALQTFPREFLVTGPRAEIQRQIGNAVPSLFGEIIGRAIASQLSGQVFAKALSLEIPRVKYFPNPESLGDVPSKYLKYVGIHKPHPGTGKGNSYQFAREAKSLNSISGIDR